MAKAKAPELQIQPSIFASVAFLKIHDFGRRPVVEQARLRAQLEAVVAVALPELKENARIVLDAADGIALVVLDDPRAVLALAGRTLAAGAVGLPLSIGINHGPVKHSGKGKGEGLLGDGIAVAAAIAELAGPQKLLLTRDFRQALEDAAPGAEAALAVAGTHTDASLRAHELYRHDPLGAARRGTRYLAATVAAAIALAGAGIAFRVSVEGLDRYTNRMSAQAKDVVSRLRSEVTQPAPPPPAPARAASRRSR
jgi:class 3 adenylate cyclase